MNGGKLKLKRTLSIGEALHAHLFPHGLTVVNRHVQSVSLRFAVRSENGHRKLKAARIRSGSSVSFFTGLANQRTAMRWFKQHRIAACKAGTGIGGAQHRIGRVGIEYAHPPLDSLAGAGPGLHGYAQVANVPGAVQPDAHNGFIICHPNVPPTPLGSKRMNRPILRFPHSEPRQRQNGGRFVGSAVRQGKPHEREAVLADGVPPPRANRSSAVPCGHAAEAARSRPSPLLQEGRAVPVPKASVI